MGKPGARAMPDSYRSRQEAQAARAVDQAIEERRERRERLNGHAFEPGQPQDADEWPAPLDLVALSSTEPQRPSFVIDQWLPQSEVTLLGAHGGIGKSMIGLQLAVCVACGQHFFGLEVQQRRAAFVSYEDSAAVLAWRLHRICAWMSVPMVDLADQLLVADGSRSIGSWFSTHHGEAGPTKQFFGMAERLAGYEVIVVDGASDTFAANENDRGQVKGFIRMLRRLVPSTGALLLLAHVDKQTAKLGASSEGYSGSTGWHNGPRARWYVRREQEDGDTDSLIMELQKSNLGRSGAQIKLRWDEQMHVFDGDAVAGTAFDRKHQSRVELDGIRAAFAAAAANGCYVPAALQGQRTAYSVLSAYPQFPQSLKGRGASKLGRFRTFLEELRLNHHIEECEQRRAGRHAVFVLALTAEGKCFGVNSQK